MNSLELRQFKQNFLQENISTHPLTKLELSLLIMHNLVSPSWWFKKQRFEQNFSRENFHLGWRMGISHVDKISKSSLSGMTWWNDVFVVLRTFEFNYIPKLYSTEMPSKLGGKNRRPITHLTSYLMTFVLYLIIYCVVVIQCVNTQYIRLNLRLHEVRNNGKIPHRSVARREPRGKAPLKFQNSTQCSLEKISTFDLFCI